MCVSVCVCVCVCVQFDCVLWNGEMEMCEGLHNNYYLLFSFLCIAGLVFAPGYFLLSALPLP
mgnify:CR=1 FL=1